MMTDLELTVAQVQDFGILAEDTGTINERLELAIKDVAKTSGIKEADLGLGDWASNLARDLKAAVHKEICDPTKGTVKEIYGGLLDQALSPTGVTAVAAVAAVVMKIVAAVNPTFAVPTVAVYIAVWLLKFGLNRWCAVPAL